MKKNICKKMTFDGIPVQLAAGAASDLTHSGILAMQSVTAAHAGDPREDGAGGRIGGAGRRPAAPSRGIIFGPNSGIAGTSSHARTYLKSREVCQLSLAKSRQSCAAGGPGRWIHEQHAARIWLSRSGQVISKR